MLSFHQPDIPSTEYKIFTSIKGFPVDLTAVLVAVHIFSMLVCTFIIAVQPAWIRQFICSAKSLYSGQLWQFVTYVFFHDIGEERIWFVIGMAMLLWFGRPIESTIGTFTFGLMYAACTIVPVFLLVLASPALPISSFAGSRVLHLVIFVGFAILFPDTMIFRILQARWVALIFLAIDTLSSIAYHDWTTLLNVWLSAGFIYVYLRYLHGEGILRQFMARFRNRPNLRIYKPKESRKPEERMKSEQILDTLLQKISREGIDSLSPKEKRQLENARKKMMSDKDGQ
jgi:hypothetical protein